MKKSVQVSPNRRRNRRKPYDQRSRTNIQTRATNDSPGNSSSANAVQACATPHNPLSIPNGVPESSRISQTFGGQEQTTPDAGLVPWHSLMQLPLPTSALASQVHDDESITSQADSRVHGFFTNAHHINMYNPIMQDFSNQTPSPFMENFAKHIMPGASYDSSARFPPPRCHAGTRLETVKRARDFNTPGCKKRLLWIVGPAGVGKSAVMQTTAETSPSLGASFFFTVSIRDDPSKLFVTLAYQICVHHSAYRERLQAQLSLDPTLLEKSVTVQFEAFFVNPFGISRIHESSDPLLILVDGLDECAGSNAQHQILELISGFVTRYPSAPLLWIIVSRPEPHITLFFDRLVNTTTYDKLELSYDSTESQQDVEHFLRARLSEIRDQYPHGLSYLPQWPPESQILLLLAAADGMFAYAEAVIRFIEDPNIADPVSQLEVVLDVINHTMAATIGDEDSPMAQLYALYDRILSRIPPRIFPITKQILIGAGVVGSFSGWKIFGPMCQQLGLTASKAYSALHHLHAVLIIPSPETAFQYIDGQVRARHKSFQDFLSSRFPDVTEESWENLSFSCYLRTFKDIPITGEPGENPYQHIVLYWPEVVSDRKETQTEIYSKASSWLAASQFLKPRILLGDPDTLHALRVMSIGHSPHGGLLTCGRSATYSWFLDDGSLSPILRNRGLLQDWKINSLDFDLINADYCLHIICDSRKGLHYSLRKTWRQQSCIRDTESGHWEEFRKPEKHSGLLHKFEVIAPCRCKCTQTAWKHLEYARVHTPETLVMVYIPAHRRGIVVCDLPDREHREAKWRYIIPYIFPPDK